MSIQSQGLTVREGMELWVMQTDSSVYLEVFGFNRFGQGEPRELKIGPNRRGMEFQISTDDREESQRRIVDQSLDPFRNGTFVRRDKPQDADPNTASPSALDTEKLLEICELPQDKFQVALEDLGEIPLRRMLEVAQAMDISHQKVVYLQNLIRDRYMRWQEQDLGKAIELS